MVYLVILSVTLLALMLYFRKMLRIEKQKNVNVNKTKTKATDPEAEVKKIMRQTGLTYDLALQIHNGNDSIKVNKSNDKIKHPFKAKY